MGTARRRDLDGQARQASGPRWFCADLDHSNRSASAAHTANAQTRRSWRAMSLPERPDHLHDAGSDPSASGALCSAA